MRMRENLRAKSPLVSIGLPVYNGEKYIQLAVEAILQQDYADFELIISDNASTDATPEICQELAAKDKRIRYSRNATNIGASPNMKRVFELSGGEFFALAAHDDLYLPGLLRRCVELLSAAPPNVVLVAPRAVVIDEEGRSTTMQVERLQTKRRTPHQRAADILRNVQWATAQYGLYRANALRKTRLIDAFPASDYVLLFELAILGEIWEVPETLFQRRYHPGISTKVNKNHAEFAAWFGQKQNGKSDRPRLGLEYARSVARMPLPLGERVLCFGSVFSVWYLRRLRAIASDYADRLRSRLKGSTQLHGDD
jgi:glycosyltransferase involved in cell wall biosynthesis